MGEVITGHVLRKREANRQNAQRSTGPRTLSGKQCSSRNARRHGLLCRELAVLEAGENGAELKALLKQLWEHYAPDGPVEGYLMEQIAVSMWQMRRAQRVEAAEIRRYLRERSVRVSPGASKMWDEGIRHMLGEDADLRQSSAGIAELLKLLELAEFSLPFPQQFPPKQVATELREKFGAAENGFAVAFDQVRSVASGVSAEQKPIYQQMLQGMIARERAHLERLKKERLAEEAVRRQEQYDERREPVLPDEVLARYQRYKSWYQKEFYRALDQLERLQRQRKGDYVPPPANLYLSANLPSGDTGCAPPGATGLGGQSQAGGEMLPAAIRASSGCQRYPPGQRTSVLQNEANKRRLLCRLEETRSLRRRLSHGKTAQYTAGLPGFPVL